jgi:hypothetical protein
MRLHPCLPADRLNPSPKERDFCLLLLGEKVGDEAINSIEILKSES